MIRRCSVWTAPLVAARFKRFLPVSVLTWCHSCVCLEELVEHGRIREMQFENDLLNAVVGVLEHILGLQNHERVDPVRRRPSAYLLDKLGKVFGCQAKMARIEGHVPF